MARAHLWLLISVAALAGCGSAALVAGPDYVRTAAGGYVLADPSPGMTVRLGAKPILNAAEAAASSDDRAADPGRRATPL